MRIFFDDERETPPGWERVYRPDEAIAVLKTGRVTEISLDHDLGDDVRGTGYDVSLWIEEAVVVDSFVLPRICVHSVNSFRQKTLFSSVASWKLSHQRKFAAHSAAQTF
jgi:hypothetical protein